MAERPTPDPSSPNFVPVCAIGASAGGVAALQALFRLLPNDLGLAYVVVVHLSPDHPSAMHEILGAVTAMPVFQVQDGPTLQANCVYVIAPDSELVIEGDEVHARPFTDPRGRRAPIDMFFRSIATARGDGIAVVLTGAGADGAVGVRAIKEAGGIVMVQEPTEAGFPSMPRNAIATGVADVIAPISRLAERIADAARSKDAVRSLDEDGAANDVRRIITFLRTRTGHDFSGYKRATVLRRITRRMQVCQILTLADYAKHLRTSPEEAKALFADLLISVTAFFRDPAAFVALGHCVIRPLLESRSTGETEDELRAWVVGCATGEEAYSVAITLLEEAQQLGVHVPVQIFATDLDESALATAREGRYPRSIEADVSAERLRTFFVDEGTHYRVTRQVRDLVLFATHSVVREPPFMRLDLITCRNVLIYLERSLQQHVCSIFHYGLKRDGFLFLGSAETADASQNQFTVVDREARIYRALASSAKVIPASPPGPVTIPVRSSQMDRSVAATRFDAGEILGESHAAALEAGAPPSALVDAGHAVLHLSPNAGRFILLSAGPLSNRLPSIVRPELRLDLKLALDRVFETREPTITRLIDVDLEGERRRISLHIAPVSTKEGAAQRALVYFLDNGPGRMAAAEEQAPLDELQYLYSELKVAQEAELAGRMRHESAVQELRASNEELQSLNEEYRSTAEELETSKEELQSINEELQTVNAELKSKLAVISAAHNDLKNLTDSSEIGTLFLDPALRIRMFTPPVAELVNVTDADVGRPITHLTHRFRHDGLERDVRRVLRDLVPIETETWTQDDRCFLVRVRPYRTLDGQVEGAVVTFDDITAREQGEAALRESEARYRTMFQSMNEGYLLADVICDEQDRPVDFEYLEANPAATRMTGVDLTGRRLRRVNPDYEEYWYEIFGRVALTGIPAQGIQYAKPEGIWYDFNVTKVDPAQPGSRRIAIRFFDATARVQAEHALRESEQLRRIALEGGRMGAWRWDLRDKLIWGDAAFLALWGFPPSDEPRQLFDFTERMSAAGRAEMGAMVTQAIEVGQEFDGQLEVAAGATRGRWIRWRGRAEMERPWIVNGVSFDVTEQHVADERLKESEARYASLFAASPVPFMVLAPNRPDFTITAANDAYFAATLTTPETLIGRRLFDVFPDDPNRPGQLGSEALAVSLDRVLATKRTDAMARVRYDIVTPDGGFEPHWWRAINAPMLDAAGDVSAIIHQVDRQTELHLAEQAERESQERQAFLLTLGDALRPLADPVAIQGEATRLLGERLGVGWCYYGEIGATETEAVILQDFSRPGLPTMAGRHDLSGMPELTRLLRSSDPFDVPDLAASPLLDEGLAARYAAMGMRSALGTPLVKGGRLIAALVVADTSARPWSRQELTLLQDVAERTWAAVERARAEAALRDSEQRYRTVFERIDEGFCVIELVQEDGRAVDYRLVETNPAFGRQTGLGNALGRLRTEVAAGDESGWLETYGEVARTVQSQRFERYHEPTGRWYSVFVAPIADTDPPRLTVVFNDITERKRAEAALRESEEQHRRLFENMEQGYLLADVIFDEAGRPVDIAYVRANAAAVRMVGTDPTGKRLREISPDYEPYWYEIWGRVALTGRSERLERYASPEGRWYVFQVFKPEPDPASRRVAVIFDDATERKRAEERQSFLLGLSDALRPLDAPDAIMETVTRLLGGRLGVSRCAYYEIEDDDYVIRRDSAVGVPSLVGRHPSAVFGSALLGKHTAGQTPIVVEDVALAHAAAERDAFAAIQVGAYVGVTLFKRDRFVAGLTVQSVAPRAWTGVEVSLLQDVAERTWAAVERARAEAALRESEARFRSFAENSADVLWIADATGARMEYLSPAFERVFGAPRDAVMADPRRVRDLVHPDDRIRFDAAMPRAVAGETVIIHYRVVRPGDGQVVHLRDTGFPIHDEAGVVVRVAGIVQDVTDIARTEEALEAEKERSRTLAEGIPQLVWRSGEDGLWTWSSPQWQAFTGQSQAESQGWGWMDAIHPDDHEATRQAWHEARPHGRLDVEYRVRRAADGAWRWHAARAVPVRAAGGPDGAEGHVMEWLGTTTDIEDLKRLQGEQGVLVAELQHRTRNLLAVVRNVARRSIPASPGRDDYDARLAALGRVQGFLSRSSAYSVPLAELVQAELEAAGDGASDRVTVGGPAVELPGESVQAVALALHELATNAVKYGAIAQASGRLAVTWRVEHGGPGEDQRLVIDWRESGVAMPPGPPARRGYGGELITRALPYQLRAETALEFTPDGVRCRVVLPASAFSSPDVESVA